MTGALVITPISPASADEIRDAQWPLSSFIAEDIWKISTGEGVTVAVIDSGFRVSHQDIRNNILPVKNFGDGEKNGSNGFDTDKEVYDHGTAMASLIAGHGHGYGGESGIKGLAPESKIFPLTVEFKDLWRLQQEADAVRYAVDHGADVINMSIGESKDSRMEKAINYALANDVVVVASSGNDGTTEKIYPANYPGVIGVGAVDEYGEVWDDSNYNTSVDLVAPGVKIRSAGSASDTTYRRTSGTSDATAYVSAAAALLRAKFPNLTAGQIANRLVKTTILPDSMKDAELPDPHYGYGIIRPKQALQQEIPAGSKAGPLPMPEASATASAAPNGSGQSADDTASSASSGISTVVIALAAIGAAAVVGLVILIVILSKRRNRRNVPGGTPPFPPNADQVPPHNPYASQQQHPQQPNQWNDNR